MINSYDDLKAQRAKAHNDLEVAKVKLMSDSRSWKEQVKPLKAITSVAGFMFTNKAIKNSRNGLMGHGIQFGVNTLLSKTAFKRLPGPLSVMVPHVIENVAINYTKTHGRDWLIKGLRWIKNITEEQPEKQPAALAVVNEERLLIVEQPEAEVINDEVENNDFRPL
jgi:hypothetical protein